MAAAGVMTAGADNNQQRAAAGVSKMADMATAGAEVALVAAAGMVQAWVDQKHLKHDILRLFSMSKGTIYLR